MKVKCLSVKNPISYLIVSGIKDVENRSWTTDYRGEIYIHSSGKDSFDYCDVCDDDLFPIHAEFESLKFSDDGIPTNIDSCKYIAYDIKDNAYFLTKSGENHRNEYELFKKASAFMQTENCFFRSQAIIGKVDLVDVITNSDSPFAADGQYHWILKNPVMFQKPILYVKGKLKFFEYDIKNL